MQDLSSIVELLLSSQLNKKLKRFHSKERFIEICLIVQKERLKEKVVSIVGYDQDVSVKEKLKKLYFLHTDVEGMYYLLFKAIFEIKLTHNESKGNKYCYQELVEENN